MSDNENENQETVQDETESGENSQQTYTFPTSVGGISFSIRPVSEIRNSTRVVPLGNIYNDPIFSFLPLMPTYNTIVGGGAAAAGPGTNILNNSLYDKEAYKQVLSDEGKKEIIIRPFNKETDELKKCPIMFTEFEDNEEIAELPCGHIFDKDGIYKWLEEEDASCPVCRKKLDSKEIKNEDEDTAVPRPQLPTLTNLLRTYRQRSMAIIDDAEERMMQMAIEESLRE